MLSDKAVQTGAISILLSFWVIALAIRNSTGKTKRIRLLRFVLAGE